jgi:hypothetical protein
MGTPPSQAIYLHSIAAEICVQSAVCTGKWDNCHTRAGSSDQLALDGIHHRFQAVVGSQFLVDVMEVVSESA